MDKIFLRQEVTSCLVLVQHQLYFYVETHLQSYIAQHLFFSVNKHTLREKEHVNPYFTYDE